MADEQVHISFPVIALRPLALAARIRVIRALLGLTSREFAQHIGISVGVLTSWEKGRAAPRADRWQKIEEICWRDGVAFIPGGYPVVVLREEKNDKV